jgi:ribonuclease-3
MPSRLSFDSSPRSRRSRILVPLAASNRNVSTEAATDPVPLQAALGQTENLTSRPAKPARDPQKGAFGYIFRNPKLLDLALTHSSLAYENQAEGERQPGSDNERLEFVGDAVLGLVVAESLYRQFPALREGELTRMRASLVSRRNLAEMAQRLGIGPMLRLGRGEEHSGGQKKPALLANALEAVIAAVYLDGGLGPATHFVERYIIAPAEPGLSGALGSERSIAGVTGDYKSELQERLQADGSGQPRYVLADESGPDHQKRFRIVVQLHKPDGSTVRLAEAEGTTKKQAQQEGARLALDALRAGLA